MNREEALTLLGLPQNAKEIHIEETIESRLSDLKARISQASSDSLRNKFEQNLELLQQAKSVLASSVTPDLSSLPVSEKHAHHIQSSASEAVGKYKIEKQIGKTQDVLIFSGQDDSNGQSVEIFRLQQKLSKSEQRDLENQLGELSRIQSDSVQRLLDFEINEDGSAYFVLEAVAGEPLDKIINTFDIQEQKRVIFDLCYSLSELHRFRPHGRLTLSSVMMDNGQLHLVHLPVAGLDCEPGNQKNFGSRKATIQGDITDLALIIAKILTPSLDVNADLTTAAKNCPNPIRKILLNIASGNSDKSPVSVSDFTQQLTKAFSPSISRGLQNPIFRFGVIPLLVGLLVVIFFKEQVSLTWENIRPMSSEEKQALSDSVIQGITRVETLLANYERSLSRLEQEIDRIVSQIEQEKIKGGNNKKIIERLEQSLDRKHSIMNIAEDGVVARTQLPTLKGDVSVIKQHLGKKDFEGAKLLLATIENKMGETNNLINTLENLQNERERLAEVKSKLAKLMSSKFSPEFIEQSDKYDAMLEQYIKNGKFRQAMAEGLKPLLKMYINMIYTLEQKNIEKNKTKHKYFIQQVRKNLIKIPGGEFKMGARRAGFYDARPVHTVRIKPFYMSRYPVTNYIYKHYKNGNKKENDDHPVVNVSWNDANNFVTWISLQIGLRCYLPSESQWEYVAKAGMQTKYPWGNGIGKNKANCAACSSNISSTSPVMKYKPNQFGLNDMQGNVWEWVKDCYVNSYTNARNDGSSYEYKQCKRHVLRGGAWNSTAKEINPAYRNAALVDFESDTIGFRFACD